MAIMNGHSIHKNLRLKPIHPFPARMAPSIVEDVLAGAPTPLRVLDPMMGSGTVLALAQLDGHIGIGFDIDPLAVLISRVWTTPIESKIMHKRAIEVLDKAQTIFKNIPVGNAYPAHADEETRAFIRFWFDSYARRQLAALARAIGKIRDEKAQNVLWCGFSRLIIAKKVGASLAKDLSHSRPHKSFVRAPAKPFRNFLADVDRVIANCPKTSELNTAFESSPSGGDARNMSLDDSCVDLVLTSPPYLNAIDYMRCSKFSLVWMGYSIADLRKIRADSIGAEGNKPPVQNESEFRSILAALNLQPKLGKTDEAMLIRYIGDMSNTICEIARVLAPGGRAVFVIGENTIRGTHIKNSILISELAKSSGLRVRGRRFRSLSMNRRYLPPPTLMAKSSALDSRMHREVILFFDKPNVK